MEKTAGTWHGVLNEGGKGEWGDGKLCHVGKAPEKVVQEQSMKCGQDPQHVYNGADEHGRPSQGCNIQSNV